MGERDSLKGQLSAATKTRPETSAKVEAESGGFSLHAAGWPHSFWGCSCCPLPAQLDIQALPAAYHTTPVATQPEVPVPAPPAKASLPRSVAIAKTNSKWHNGVCSLQGKVHHQPCRQPQEGDQAFHVNSRVNRAVVTRWWVGQGDHEAQRHQDLSRIKDAASASTHSLLKTSLAWQKTQLKTLHNELFEVKAKVGCEFAASRNKSRRCSEQLTRVARRISVLGDSLAIIFLVYVRVCKCTTTCRRMQLKLCRILSLLYGRRAFCRTWTCKLYHSS